MLAYAWEKKGSTWHAPLVVQGFTQIAVADGKGRVFVGNEIGMDLQGVEPRFIFSKERHDYGGVVGRDMTGRMTWLAAWSRKDGRYRLEQMRRNLPGTMRENLEYRDAIAIAFFAAYMLPQMSGALIGFGAGNIFRAFPAAVLNDALNSGKYDRGVIVAESFDYEIIDKAYQPYDNLSLLVCLKSTGEIEKKVIASVTESLKADYSFGADWARLVEIFQNPSLQMISFTITEKGYGVAPADLERGLTPVLAMGKVTALLYERFKAGKLPLTVQSMDNCSHNGDKVKTAVHAYAAKWVEQGLVPAEFLAYVQDETKITFPWSMIDKITPRPDAKVQEMLAKDGFEDNYTIVTEKHTFTAPFVNAEETQYLCIEDHYTNGRPPLELGGVLYCDRETVDKIEKMKVCTCLNPLHTAMSIYGCMLGYTLISAELADEDLRSFIQKIGYIEAMPVVVDPGVLNPYEFIGAVINRRLPNPFMPDAPQRIVTDTSQKLAIRFGETIKAYEARGLDKSNLVLIPLVLAGYARYLKGIDDNGQPFEISTDPLLAELQAIVAPLKVEAGEQDFSCLKALYSRTDVFGVDLYAVGLGEKIESMAKELFAGPGAVRATLHKYVKAR